MREEIDAELRRRILARHPDYQRAAILGDGGEPAQAMLLDIERLRACADHLLSVSPIPVNYRSDHHWNGYPPGFRFVTQVVAAVAAPAVAAAPVPQYVQQPSVVVVNPPAQSQHVSVSPPGAHVVMPQAHPYIASPSQTPAGTVPAFPGGAPIPPVSVDPGYYVHPSPMPQTAYPSVQPVASTGMQVTPNPVSRSSDVAPPPEVWSPAKEAGYQICKAAVSGDADAISRIKPIADRNGVSVEDFCHGYASERAFALNRHNEMNGNAA